MYIKNICFISLFLFLFVFEISGQIMPGTDDVEIAKNYLKVFENSTVVAHRSETKIEFFKSGKENTPLILEEEEIQFMSIRAQNLFVKTIYYDDNSETTLAIANNKKGRSIKLSSVCGNYENENIFYSDAKLCNYRYGFTYLGETLNFKSRKLIKDVKYLTGVYFTDAFAAGNRKVVFHIPDWMDVELKEFNFKEHEIVKNVHRDEKEKITIIEYWVKNIDAFQSENLSRGLSFTYPHVLVLSKSYTLNGEKRQLLGSLNDLYSWYASLVSMVKNDQQVLEAKVKDLIKDKSSDEEKIKAIYYWVQDNIRYIAFENGIAGFKPEAAHLVFNNKYGDCKGMANLTKEMLKIAGFDARLTWIGTNKIAYNYSIPTLAADNHMICTVMLNGKNIYLDGTEKFISLNENAERIQGRQVLIEDGNNYLLDSIPKSDNSRNKVETELILKLIEGNKLSGKFTATLNGEKKSGLLYSINNTPADKKSAILEKLVTNGSKSIHINNLKNSALNVRETPFTLSCEYTASNKVSEFDKDLYVELEHESLFKDFTIKPERLSDYAFDEKILRTSRVSFSIPEGYKITRLPENLEIKHEAFNFRISFSQASGVIHYEREISVHNGIIEKQDFKAWNEAISGLKKAYNSKLVLTKIN